MRWRLRATGLLAMWVILYAPVGVGATVQAQLSASTIAIDESVTLTVLASGLDGELETAALERDFDVVGRSSSRQIENLNGQITNTRNWVLELMPKRTGVFTVPPVSVNGVESPLLSLTVSDAPTGADRQLFVEASVDKTTPWVQSQVILTLRVFQAVSILDGSLGEPEAPDLIVRPLGEDRRFSAERDGRAYDVLERRFAVFPQASGRLEIAPITLIASVPSNPNRVQGFFPDTRRLTRRTRPLSLDVQARPPGGTGWWLPAQSVSIEAQWAEPVSEARVDQPLTREIHLQASGVSDAQLPTIQTPIVDGAGIYADDPARGTQAGSEGLSASQKVTWAVIPQRVGPLTLPGIDIEWFDTATGRMRTTSLPPETIDVAPSTVGPGQGTGGQLDDTALNQERAGDRGDALAGSGTDTLAEPSDTGNDVTGTGNPSSRIGVAALTETGHSSLWRWLAVAALAGWGLTGFLLLRSRSRSRSRSRRPNAPPEPGHGASPDPGSRRSSLEQVRQADTSGTPAELAQAVLSWAGGHWSHDPPRTLPELAARLPSRDASEALRQLDAILYRPAAPSSSAEGLSTSDRLPALADLLEAAVEPPSDQTRVDGRIHLPEL